MSKAVNSPTARLLQTSRLFSLPRPLPQPTDKSATSTGIFRASDTATTPYPTHQAIATPSASLSRGDWGLKRPLPGKTTRNTSTPHIRIRAQDTAEHITDFASAADHTQSAAKWLEMGVPIFMPETRRTTLGRDNSRAGSVSVFESYLDHTDSEAVSGEGAAAAAASEEKRVGGDGRGVGRRSATAMEAPQPPKQRWKYTGPWIAGMQEGEFNTFLHRTTEQKKSAWLSFLRTHEHAQRIRRAKASARHTGTTLTPSALSSLLPTDAELTTLQKTLRADHATQKLSSELTALLTTFLDLPSNTYYPIDPHLSAATERFSAGLTLITPESGPPSTHPSAGLSHLRTNSIMENHPLHGPQAHHSPVLARVVRPRTSQTGANEYMAKIGVGGFVANDSVSATTESGQTSASSSAGRQPDRNTPDPWLMSQTLDPDLVGGNKMWVHPESAHVDENGRVRLAISRGQNEAIAVKVGDVEYLHEAKRTSASGIGSGGGPAAAAMPVPTRKGFSPRARAGARSAWADAAPMARNGGKGRLPGVQGFDGELGRGPREGEMEGRRMQVDGIREILGRRYERSG